jgi:hypothetical protein
MPDLRLMSPSGNKRGLTDIERINRCVMSSDSCRNTGYLLTAILSAGNCRQQLKLRFDAHRYLVVDVGYGCAQGNHKLAHDYAMS